MPTNGEIRPRDCASCRTIHAALTAHPSPDTLTVAQVAELSGLARRATITHLGHLEQAGLIEADRRTPTGATLEGRPLRPGPKITPAKWAGSVQTRDRACGQLLNAYAANGWTGSLADDVLARMSGMSVRNVKRHRPHLKADGHLQLTADVRAATNRAGRLRLTDHYTLRPRLGLVIDTPSLPAGAEHTEWWWAAAEDVVQRLQWYSSRAWQTRPEWERDRHRGVEELARAMERTAGTWTAADWHAYLGPERPDVSRPLPYLRALIASLPAAPPLSSGPAALATGQRPLLLITCDHCGRAFRSASGNTVCGPCREAGAAAV
ncbi:hypothetical protein ACIQI7_38600 [Kitasatospora sp. NPDC092039]|uniref:hypothetical protein n=1 Tax=Kitasatospora sp. NPDC092039 TaxID=3364086 RepID=UPI003801EF7A